jgi:hypothetical protein
LLGDINQPESTAAGVMKATGRAIKKSGLDRYRLDRSKDINPAPAIDVVWRPGISALRGRNKDSCVIQSITARCKLVFQVRVSIP